MSKFDETSCNYCDRKGIGNHESNCYNADREGTLTWTRAHLRYLQQAFYVGTTSVKQDIDRIIEKIDIELEREFSSGKSSISHEEKTVERFDFITNSIHEKT